MKNIFKSLSFVFIFAAAICAQTNGKVSGTPSVLLTPQWVNKSNYKVLFTDGFVKKTAVCVGKYKQYC